MTSLGSSKRGVGRIRLAARAVRSVRGGIAVAALIVAGAAVPINVGSSSAATSSVNVLYAGSLLDLVQMKIGPAFTRATGYSINGFSAGSTALANEIKGRTQVGDVFISASPAANLTLEGKANGDWVKTFGLFGTSPLVLGYNPTSRFAYALRHRPWFTVVDRTGFLLGRTDPATDPKGVLAEDALTGVALSYDVPALAALARTPNNVFPETTLVGRLQSGQLDAGFFYGVEAAAANIKTVPLAGTSLKAQYTVALLNRAPHTAVARAFIKFLLGRTGRRILSANGILPLTHVTFVTGPSGSTSTTSTPATTTGPS